MRTLSDQATAENSTSAVAVEVTNSASLLPCTPGSPNTNKCTNGMFVTFYIGPNATSVTGTFNFPWPQILDDHFQLRFESCGTFPNNSIAMAILGVYQQDGYQQVNAYVQGDELITQGEPFGQCNPINGTLPNAAFNIVAAPSSPFRIANGNQQNYFKFVNLEKATPGIFSANGSGVNGAPAGFHLKYVNGAPIYTALATCNTDPSQCPITTNGQTNYLVLYTTGGENIQCGSLPACMAVPERPGISFKNPAGTSFVRTPIFIGEVYLGQEQWNIAIDTLVPNQYTLTAVFGVRDVSSQALTVTFSSGN